MAEYSGLRLATAAAAALLAVLALVAYALAGLPSGVGAASEALEAPREETGPAINDTPRDRNEAAIRAHIECVEASGIITAVTLPGDGLRADRVAYRVAATEESKHGAMEAAQQVFDDCRAEHIDANALAVEHSGGEPSEAEINRAMRLIRSCVDEGQPPGILGDWPFGNYAISPAFEGKRIEIEAHQRQLYADCALDVEAETGIQAPAPLVAGDDDPVENLFD